MQERLWQGFAALACLVGLCLSTVPARAFITCVPDPAVSGQTVICSGVVLGGFAAGAGVNNLTVNVLSGATIGDNGTASIGVNDSNTVTNAGSLLPAAGLIGINAGNSNTIVNSGTMNVGDFGAGIIAINANTITNSGSITAGANGVAISVGDNNVVTNSGTLAAGSSGFGIFAGVSNNVINAAAGIITVVANGSGIFVAGNSTVTNAGSITVGSTFGFSAGIVAINDFNTVINSLGASINVGSGAVGVVVQGNDATVSNAGSITAVNQPALFVQGDRAVISNSGTLTTGNTGAGIVFSGSLGTVTNSGSIVGGKNAEGMVVFGDSNSITNAGTITVGNGVNSTGIGVTSFAGSNSIVNTGTITVGTGGIGIFVSGTANVFNSGTINAAAGSAAIEFCGCGVGNVLTLGPGSVINGLVTGTGTDTFQLGGTGKDTFNLSLIGSGKQYDGFSIFNKVGSSNWTVTGTGAQNWNVLGGTLSVNGTINGNVVVSPGATLGGNGFVGNTTINGALAPGNSVGLLTVQGNLVFSTAASYMVEISSANSADRTTVTGVATPGGATVNVNLAGATSIARQYTILDAASISGTFNPVVVTSNASNFTASLSYGAKTISLNFALNFGGGLNVNQQNAANAITGFFNSNGSIPLVFGALTPAGLAQVSGEHATGSQQATFDAMNIFLGLMTDPFIAGRDGGVSVGGTATSYASENSSYADAAKNLNAAHDAFAKMPAKAAVARNDLFNPGWSVWGAPFGGGASTSGNAALGSNNATAREFGFAAGADYRFSPATLAGFALAGGGTNFSVNGSGSGRSDLFQAGVFVRHNVGAAYVTGALAYGWQDVTTDRTVTVAGVDRLRAEFKANAWSGRVEGGYRFATPWMGITPYAAGQFTTYSLPAYAEQVLSGSNNFALSYAAKDVTASRSELGLRSDKSFAMENGILTLRGRLAWAHEFNTDRNVTALFQTLPGATFVVNGAALAHDSALTTASAEMKLLNGWSAAATFEGQFSNVTSFYAGKGVVRYAW